MKKKKILQIYILLNKKVKKNNNLKTWNFFSETHEHFFPKCSDFFFFFVTEITTSNPIRG